MFRAGDVLVRDGASSRRADQNAVREQISKMRRRERERWTEEILGVRELTSRLDRLIDALGGLSVSDAGGTTGRAKPSTPHDGTNNYFLGASTFENVVLEALRADNDIDVRWYLNNAASTFYRGGRRSG